MLTDWAVDSRRAPICSAIDMKRLVKTSSRTGSASVPTPERRRVHRHAFQHQVSRRVVTAACQPGSTTVVAPSSVMIAGPLTVCRPRPSRRCSADLVPGHCRCTCGLDAGRSARLRVHRRAESRSAASVGPVASTERASTTRGRSRLKE